MPTKIVIFQYHFGDLVRDKVTGYTGAVLGRSDTSDGCVTYALQGLTLNDLKPVAWEWLDQSRLELVKENYVSFSPTTPTPPLQS